MQPTYVVFKFKGIFMVSVVLLALHLFCLWFEAVLVSLILGVIADWWWHHPCSSTSWGKWEENTFVTFRPDREGNRDGFVDLLSWQLALCHCHAGSGEKCPDPGNKINLPPLKMIQISRMHIFDWCRCKNKYRTTYTCAQKFPENHSWMITCLLVDSRPVRCIFSLLLMSYSAFHFIFQSSKFAPEGSLQKPSLAAN